MNSQFPQIQPQPAGGGYEATQTLPNANKPHVRYNKGWYTAKIVLECLCLAAATVALACAGYLAAQLNSLDNSLTECSEDGYTKTFISSVIYLVIVGPPTAASLCWTTASLITTCARTRLRQGIHPGAQVALHLLLWMGHAGVAGLTTPRKSDYGSCSYTYFYYLFYYNKDGYSEASQVVTMYLTMVAFLYLLTVLHFTLFVRACVETSQYNRSTAGLQTALQASSSQPQPASPGGSAPIFVAPGWSEQQQYVPVWDRFAQQQQPPMQQSLPPGQPHASWVSGYNQGQMIPRTNRQSYAGELSATPVPARQQQNQTQQSEQGVPTQIYEMVGDKK